MDDQTERMYELMRVESNRLKTFQMNPPWPKDYVDIKKLAKAGFFYAFNGDKVHCAFCRGQVCRWDRDDDPMTEHAKHFTTCPFIMGGEVGNEPLGEDPFPGPKRPRPYDVCGIHAHIPPTDTRVSTETLNQRQQQQNALDIQPQQSLYARESANHNHNSNNNEQFHYGSNHPEQASGNNLLTEQNSVMNPYQQVESNINTINNLISHNYQNPDSHHTRHSPSSNTSNSSSSPNSLTGICKICYTNSIELGFLPCGHMSCLSCAQRLHRCPFCRSTITTRMRFYV